MDYVKRKEESLVSYWIRLYKNRSIYGLTFAECGELMNEVSGENWNEARWRRTIQNYLEIQDYLDQENPAGVNQDVLQEIEDQKLELEKEKIRMRDQKRLLNKNLRELARLEHLEEYLKDVLEEYKPVSIPPKFDSSDKIGFVALSDWHIGAEVDNTFNKFNHEVAEERISKFKGEVLSRLQKENVKDVYIANLGDAISGHIHVGSRIEASENAIEQIIRATQYFEDFIKDFLIEGYNVTFINVGGNHSRIIPNKKDSLGTNENFERLITVYLDKVFSQYDNYKSINDSYGIVELNIRGKKVVISHGDYEKGKNPVSRLNELLNTNIDYLFTGHVHNAFYREHGQSTHIGVGTLMGADSYATYSRFSSRPSQTFCTFDDNGIDLLKTVYL